MRAALECKEFEEEVEKWEIPESSTLAGFKELEQYPNLRKNVVYPTCKLPCFHFSALADPDAHATFTKREDRVPFVVNTLFDLAIIHQVNLSYIHTRLQLLSRYQARKTTGAPPLATIPEDRPLPDLSPVVEAVTDSVTGLKSQIVSLKADLREIKAGQTSIKLALSDLREVVTALTERELDPKPIEADTAKVAEQLKVSVKEIQASLKDLKDFAKSLVPEA
ncbi:ORF1 [Codonopsis vein clearing virus]|uniref:ORF1 n=1 Tax=Codonopsis vein clearing virus TaxID=2510980 RepID=A0A411AUG1_9VIRU|nr:ORF1 [Codonopsis vein clearing virus]QAX91645.1 ORF1 [Codonopsis vein clearing virus]